MSSPNKDKSPGARKTHVILGICAMHKKVSFVFSFSKMQILFMLLVEFCCFQ